ncbi:hypothetical protein FHR24_001484 [Wenyingzhuangia heitensis]|uniref:Phage virion morphogenesis family protein n=1 Tax=Wenyingzhuangia heitensis TaxID=1487859 RepID=A0ABX0U874_9FLAO|nr:hypothetical protein [Wenyingzhuangia heitensis]NIJ45045.1 hypothetical protein [Wenyingzhuangia heitensis]
MDFKQISQQILKDANTELSQEFDRNFERKAFFDEAWKSDKYPNSKGSTLVRSGKGRRSIQNPTTTDTDITWSSNLPYMKIQNEGGEIEVTKKMKSFFWAMYYKVYGGIQFNVRKKAMANTQRNKRLSAEAQKWKAMAMQPVGTKMKIEQRQFIGEHPEVHRILKQVVDVNMKEVEQNLKNSLKR